MPKLDASTRRYLTKESIDPSTKLPVGILCDLDGKALGASAMPLPVFDDASGKAWVRIVPVMPSNPDPASVALRDSYMALSPVFVDGEYTTMRGWYVPAPDFGLKPAASAAPAPAATGAVSQLGL